MNNLAHTPTEPTFRHTPYDRSAMSATRRQALYDEASQACKDERLRNALDVLSLNYNSPLVTGLMDLIAASDSGDCEAFDDARDGLIATLDEYRPPRLLLRSAKVMAEHDRTVTALLRA